MNVVWPKKTGQVWVVWTSPSELRAQYHPKLIISFLTNFTLFGDTAYIQWYIVKCMFFSKNHLFYVNRFTAFRLFLYLWQYDLLATHDSRSTGTGLFRFWQKSLISNDIYFHIVSWSLLLRKRNIFCGKIIQTQYKMIL